MKFPLKSAVFVLIVACCARILAQEDVPVKSGATTTNLDDKMLKVTVVDGGPKVTVPVGKPGDANALKMSKDVPKMRSPYPAKVLSEIPAGWMLVVDPEVPVQLHQLTLNDGRKIELSIIPPLLVPAREGAVVVKFPVSGMRSPTDMLAEVRLRQVETRDKLQEMIGILESQLPDASLTPKPTEPTEKP